MRTAIFAFALAAAPAAAVTLDPGTPGAAIAQRSVEVGGVVTTSDDFGTFTVGDASVTVTASPVAAVLTSAKSSAGTSDTGASGTLNYQYLVKVAAGGSTPNTILNLVTIKGVAKINASGLAFGTVQAVSGAGVDGTSASYYNDFNTYYAGDGGLAEAWQIGGAGRYNGTVDNGDGTQSLVYVGELGLFAGGRAYAAGGTVTALIDPLITINNASLQNAGFSGPATLVLSTGIANASAAPEPEAWALLVVGLGGLGMAARRRRAGLRPA